MPRAARKKSATGIYHIMVRGINREYIYQDEIDKGKFVEMMGKVSIWEVFWDGDFYN